MSAASGPPEDVLAAHLAAPPLRELGMRAGGGLVLLAGPARSGRSTTLAALLDALLRAAPRHALVLDTSEEESSSYGALGHPLLAHKRIADAGALARALRASLARDADVLAIDELATSEAIDLALAAACGGTLVLAAVPGDDVPDALQRLARASSAPVAARLATCLRLASCQRLLRARDGSRHVARELLARGPNALAALRGFDLEAVRGCMVAGGRPQTLDAVLTALLDAGTIEGAEAYAHARDPRPFARFAPA